MPTKSRKACMEETEAVAQVLFMQFCRDRFHEEGIDEVPVCDEEESTELVEYFKKDHVDVINGYSHPMMAALGQDLRRIAESFENSREREQIRETVTDMNLDNATITYDHFRTLLTELFTNGGITREKIVILFFFCSDLAVKAFRCNYIQCLWRMLGWSLRFIFEHVCSWVVAKGGWENVLGNFVPKLVFTAAGILTCAALAVYIRKNW